VRARALFLAAALACGGAATAAEAPHPGFVDPRIRSIYYDSDQVVTLTGYFGFQTMVEFDPDEHIENVSIGDALGWQVTPNKRANLLFLKPLDRSAPTNMTVVTDRRRYVFELRARAAGAGRVRDMAYVVRFTYPPPPLAPEPIPPPPPPPPPERSNVAYSYTGSRAALPSVVFDDGRFTYFQWADTTSTPAIFLTDDKGAESLVNYATREGFIVVEQLAPRFVLRNGKEVTMVINDGWRPQSPGPLAPRPHDAKAAKEAKLAGAAP
jgi:type IV secretion system protein VirB9